MGIKSKSTLLEIFQEYLLANGVGKEQIIAVNLEDYDYLELRNPEMLYAYIKECLIDGKRNYIFLDEVQHVENFSDVVDSLFIKKGLDIYLTGSNAYMLSGEIATLISGRYVEIPMLPLSFKEYVLSTGDTGNLLSTKKIADTMTSAGRKIDVKTVEKYLNALIESFIIYQAKRYNIKGKQYLKSLDKYYVVDIGLRRINVLRWLISSVI